MKKVAGLHTRRNPVHAHMEIGEFGVGRPDFGGRWPRGEALGKKEKGLGKPHGAQRKGL